MFIVSLSYKKPFEIVEKFLEAHRSYLDEGYAKNFLIASGPKNPRTGGIMISQLKNRDQLETFLHSDPFYLNDIAEFEIVEFNPVKFHKDFENFV